MLLRLTAGRAPTMSTEFHEVRLVRERLLADLSCQPGPFQNQQQTLDVAAPDLGGPVCATWRACLIIHATRAETASASGSVSPARSEVMNPLSIAGL